MVTWTTYGTWLQGDKKGSVRKGKVLRESKGLQQANERKRTGESVKLKKAECEVVREAILKEAERIGEEIAALSIWSNHVHVVFVLIVAQRLVFSRSYRKSTVCFRVPEGVPAPD